MKIAELTVLVVLLALRATKHTTKQAQFPAQVLGILLEKLQLW